jgi:hypothetical protein
VKSLTILEVALCGIVETSSANRTETKETRMRKAVGFIAVIAGAPLVALAIGAPTAWAAPSTGNGASVSINGTPHGSPNSSSMASSTPSSGSKPNIAVAVNGSYANSVDGTGNKAIAVNGSRATAGVGDNNTATAINTSTASAGELGFRGGGSNNTARATNGSYAIAGGIHSFSDSNTATATCGGNADATGGTTVTSNGGTCGK